MVNMVMGPPMFAPLLFGISAYLGLIASYLRREDARTIDGNEDTDSMRSRSCSLPAQGATHFGRAGYTRRAVSAQVAIVAGVSALLSGFEA